MRKFATHLIQSQLQFSSENRTKKALKNIVEVPEKIAWRANADRVCDDTDEKASADMLIATRLQNNASWGLRLRSERRA